MQVNQKPLRSPGGPHPADAYLRELSLHLLTFPAEQQVAPTLAKAQAKLIELLGIERSVLIGTDDHSESPVLLCSCPASGPGSQFTPCQPDKCPLCHRALRGEVVRLPAANDGSAQGVAEAESGCTLGCKSVLGFPLSDGGRIRGALLFACAQPGRPWSEDWVQLGFAARIFESALNRKQAELARRREELECRDLLETVPALVWQTDAATLQTTFVTKAFETYLGYPKEEWLTPRDVWAQKIHPEDRERVMSLAAKAVREKRGYEAEYRVIAADGRTLWMRAVVHAVVGQSQVKELVGVNVDITQLKKAQESLRAALAEVERLKNKLHEENVYLRHKAQTDNRHHRIIGQSQAIRRVLTQVEQVAPTDSTVLLLGETGTGKELLAAAIHDLSARRGSTLVCVNCAAMPAALVESELFGREKGAFTGSLARQVGRFELADGSTIFLDEVGELSLEIQVKLLRVLEARQIERLGNPKPVSVNVRIVAASNRNLEEDVADGRFRRDLYYRLNVFPIAVPPLRERREDIPLLVWAFVDEFAKTFNKNIESVEQESMEALQNYSWPGNIRELRNLIERAMIVAPGPRLRVQLPAVVALSGLPTGRKLEEVERNHMLSVLESCGWRIRGPNGAAAGLGLKPTTLEAKMTKLGIRRPGQSSVAQASPNR